MRINDRVLWRENTLLKGRIVADWGDGTVSVKWNNQPFPQVVKADGLQVIAKEKKGGKEVAEV